MTEAKDVVLTNLIREWVSETGGAWFTSKEMDRDLRIVTGKGRGLRRYVLWELKRDGVIQADGKQAGKYRLVRSDADEIDWRSADPTNTVKLAWPFKLEKLITFYPKNIAVVAGEPNTGKTALCLDFISLNQHSPHLSHLLPIWYFSSEMGPEEMKLRLSKFGPMDWAFEARERSSNFADVIRPDNINIIDYLEVGDSFWLVGEQLSAIFDKLRTGIALVTLQKKRGAELGRGAEFSLEKPRLYLAMGNGSLRIVKAKNWAVAGENPNGRKFTFQLVDGHKFVNVREE